jgi:hypothetical protein
MAIRKVIKKKLTPKGRRISAAVGRLYGAQADGIGRARSSASAEQKAIDKRLAEYNERVRVARYEAGYSPGEAVDGASRSGGDAYSGSSYRVGRGVPKVREGTGELRNNSDAERRIRKLNDRADNFKGFRELESELKTRFKREKVTQFRKTRTRSKTEKALRIGGRVIKGGTMAALAAAVLAEINKKKD